MIDLTMGLQNEALSALIELSVTDGFDEMVELFLRRQRPGVSRRIPNNPGSYEAASGHDGSSS